MSLEVASASLSQWRITILRVGRHRAHRKLQCAARQGLHAAWRSRGLTLNDQKKSFGAAVLDLLAAMTIALRLLVLVGVRPFPGLSHAATQESCP